MWCKEAADRQSRLCIKVSDEILRKLCGNAIYCFISWRHKHDLFRYPSPPLLNVKDKNQMAAIRPHNVHTVIRAGLKGSIWCLWSMVTWWKTTRQKQFVMQGIEEMQISASLKVTFQIATYLSFLVLARNRFYVQCEHRSDGNFTIRSWQVLLSLKKKPQEVPHQGSRYWQQACRDDINTGMWCTATASSSWVRKKTWYTYKWLDSKNAITIQTIDKKHLCKFPITCAMYDAEKAGGKIKTKACI